MTTRPPRRRAARAVGLPRGDDPRPAQRPARWSPTTCPGQYVLSVRLGLPVSLRDEPRDREGVATIMARSLDEGTERHSAEEFARLLERKGVSFGAGMLGGGSVARPRRRQGEPRAGPRPAPPDPHRAGLPRRPRWLGRCARAWPRSTRSVRCRRTARAGVRAHVLRARRSVPPPDRRHAGDGVPRSPGPTSSRFHEEHVTATGMTVVVAGDLVRPGHPRARRPPHWLGGGAGVSRPPSSASPAALAEDRERDRARRPTRARCRPRVVIGAPGPDRSVEGGWAPYPGDRLRARRVAERADRCRASRGEGLHLRHPLELPAPTDRRACSSRPVQSARTAPSSPSGSSSSFSRAVERLLREGSPVWGRLHRQDGPGSLRDGRRRRRRGDQHGVGRAHDRVHDGEPP